jgi:hypothetical protein
MARGRRQLHWTLYFATRGAQCFTNRAKIERQKHLFPHMCIKRRSKNSSHTGKRRLAQARPPQGEAGGAWGEVERGWCQAQPSGERPGEPRARGAGLRGMGGKLEAESTTTGGSGGVGAGRRQRSSRQPKTRSPPPRPPRTRAPPPWRSTGSGTGVESWTDTAVGCARHGMVLTTRCSRRGIYRALDTAFLCVPKFFLESALLYNGA